MYWLRSAACSPSCRGPHVELAGPAPLWPRVSNSLWGTKPAVAITTLMVSLIAAIHAQAQAPGKALNAYAVDAPHHLVVPTSFTEPFGPMKVNGALYIWGQPSDHTRIYKSSDGQNWVSQDDLHADPNVPDAVWFSGTSKIVLGYTTLPNTHYLVNYDLTTDTYGTQYAVTNAWGSDVFIGSIRVLSNGDVVAVFVDAGLSLNYVVYSGGAWGPVHKINSAPATVKDYVAIPDPSDGITFVYNVARDDATYTRRLAGGVLSPEVRLDTLIGDTIYTFGYGTVYNGTIYVPYYNDTTIVPSVLVGTPYSNPTWTKQIVDNTTNVGPGIFVNASVVGGNLVYSWISYGSQFGGAGVPNALYQSTFSGGIWQPKTFPYDSVANPPAGVTPPISGVFDIEALSVTADGVAVTMPIAGFAGDVVFALTSADLTAVKTNNVAGATALGSGWIWDIKVANSGSAAAAFDDGQTILTDTLPNNGVVYGSVSVSNLVGVTNSGAIHCTIAGNNLNCVAQGAKVTMATTSSFDVTFSATPGAAGVYSNPRTGGTCAVDPGNVVLESNEGNNNCVDSVTVNAADLTAIKTNNVGGQGTVGKAWTWKITVANAGGAAATFGAGTTILTDSLPNGTISYGSAAVLNVAGTVGNSTSINCTISGSVLTCIASPAAVTLGPGSSFDVSFATIASAAGFYSNPRSGGSCVVDPGNAVMESNEGNNQCADNVSVTAPAQTVAPVLQKSFSSPTVPPGNSVTLTFTIANSNATSLSGIGFTDTLPTGLVVTTPGGPTAACGGTLQTTTTTIQLSGASLDPGASCTVTVGITALGNASGRLCNTTSAITSNEIAKGATATACISVGDLVEPGDVFQVNYISNLNLGDSFVILTNTGTQGTVPVGNICVNVYAFDPAEELVACCSCLVTPNGLDSLSAQSDLIDNTLTPARPTSIVVKLVASSPIGGLCDPSTPTFENLASGMRAWGTTLHPVASSSVPAITENPFTDSTLSDAELQHLTQFCGFIQANGSGFGLCNSCRVGGLGGARR